MGISEYLSSFSSAVADVFAGAAPVTELHAEAAQAEEQEQTEQSEVTEAPAEEEEEEEEEEEAEAEDIMPKLNEECAETVCSAKKHHYDECVARVTGAEEAGEATKEDCVEEFFHLVHCTTACAAPKLFAQLK